MDHKVINSKRETATVKLTYTTLAVLVYRRVWNGI